MLFLVLPACAKTPAAPPADASAHGQAEPPEGHAAHGPAPVIVHDVHDAHDAQGRDDIARLRLGHYSTRDGLVGFVLDRMGERPRMRLDGTTDVIELVMRRETAIGTDFAAPHVGVILRLMKNGDVIYLGGPADPLDMVRDGPAAPLPAPPPLPPVTPRLVASLEAQLLRACGAKLSFVIEGTSGRDGAAAERVTDALLYTCRDEIGARAVRARIKKIVVRGVHDVGLQRVSFVGEALVVDTAVTLASGGLFTDEIVEALEGSL
jgi:hypothetical protein